MSVAIIVSGRFLSNSLQPFLPIALRRSKAASLESGDRSRMLVVAFRSPAWTQALALTQAGSSFLACHFAFPRLPATNPFGHALLVPTLHRSESLFAALEARRAHNPLPALWAAWSSPRTKPPLPFRAFQPLQIHSFERHRLAVDASAKLNTLRRSLLKRSARSPFTPRSP